MVKSMTGFPRDSDSEDSDDGDEELPEKKPASRSGQLVQKQAMSLQTKSTTFKQGKQSNLVAPCSSRAKPRGISAGGCPRARIGSTCSREENVVARERNVVALPSGLRDVSSVAVVLGNDLLVMCVNFPR